MLTVMQRPCSCHSRMPSACPAQCSPVQAASLPGPDPAALCCRALSSLQVQNRLGADIIMALDDVVPSTAADAARFEEATHRTTRWIDRCIAAHSRPHEQNLFAIVQARVGDGGRVVVVSHSITHEAAT